MLTDFRDAVLAPAFGLALRPIRAFLALEAASSLLLLGSAVAALAWVNLGGAGSYHGLVGFAIALGPIHFTAQQAINDGLMTAFFAVVGMEIKRELVLGELASLPRAVLPAIAALGGMVVPALIFLAFNRTGPASSGWGVPMATDIAFCVGVLSLLRARVPHGLIVFVTALAIFDDIGGILVIAAFYGHGLEGRWLGAALGAIALGAAMGRAQVRSGLLWWSAGAGLWILVARSGIHPTIAGVITGLCIPARSRDGGDPPLDRFVHLLHPWVAFVVMPLFALTNFGVDLRGMTPGALLGPVTFGTALALVAGKAAGVYSFTAIAVVLRIAPMPGRASHGALLGASATAGIGFTVALFIAGLAFPGRPDLLEQAKVGILGGSVTAGALGATLLFLARRPTHLGSPGQGEGSPGSSS